MRKKIELSKVMGKAFYDLHRDILEQKHTHYWCKGGRGSGKSSFISLEIILGMMADSNAQAVVLRKVAKNLRGSVMEQLLWAIQSLGVSAQWERKLEPLELIYKKQDRKLYLKVQIILEK